MVGDRWWTQKEKQEGHKLGKNICTANCVGNIAMGNQFLEASPLRMKTEPRFERDEWLMAKWIWQAVYGHTTTAMHEIEHISPIEYTPPPTNAFQCCRCILGVGFRVFAKRRCSETHTINSCGGRTVSPHLTSTPARACRLTKISLSKSPSLHPP